jgi:hypothetical protein
MIKPENPYRWGRLSTAYLPELTSIDQLLLKMETLFTQNKLTLLSRSNVQSLTLQLVANGQTL